MLFALIQTMSDLNGNRIKYISRKMQIIWKNVSDKNYWLFAMLLSIWVCDDFETSYENHIKNF